MISAEKTFVINHLLDLVGSYISLNDATMLLLGGYGDELKICLSRECSPEKIHIVEKSPGRMRKILRGDFGAVCFAGNVNHAHEMFAAMYGSKASIDYLHLDLCGALDPVEHALYSLMKLSVKSRGKCIAITTADQRANRANSDPDKIHKQSQELFDPYAENIWNSLIDLHTFVRATWNGTEADPNKVALRELSIYNHVALTCGLGNSQVFAWPDRLERVIFSSGGFRMRTYFFHIDGNERGMQQKQAREYFAELIHKAPCYYLISNQLVRVPPRKRRKDSKNMNRMEEIASLRARFELVLPVMSNSVQEDLLRLFELAEMDGVAEAVNKMEAALEEIKSESSASSASLNEAQKPVKKHPKKKESVVLESDGAPTFTPITVSDDMVLKDKVRLSLLMAGSIADEDGRQKALDAASIRAAELLGIHKLQNQADVLRGIYARSQGKFRAIFVARQLLQQPEGQLRERILVKLAKYYGERAEIILAEAKTTTLWKNAYSQS
ncbi:MAG: hypothetical protein P1P90_06745 [Patescibacteria group bacterium]|nr:hypothetical protein [Patescibacteria group bacterium]